MYSLHEIPYGGYHSDVGLQKVSPKCFYTAQVSWDFFNNHDRGLLSNDIGWDDSKNKEMHSPSEKWSRKCVFSYAKYKWLLWIMSMTRSTDWLFYCVSLITVTYFLYIIVFSLPGWTHSGMLNIVIVCAFVAFYWRLLTNFVYPRTSVVEWINRYGKISLLRITALGKTTNIPIWGNGMTSGCTEIWWRFRFLVLVLTDYSVVLLSSETVRY